MSFKLKKGDDVVVITGKDKGRKGIISSFCSKKNRVIVEGINLVKKSIKPNVNKGIEGGIIDKEASIHISNIALYNIEKNGPDRVGIKFLKDQKNKKVRYFKFNNQEII